MLDDMTLETIMCHCLSVCLLLMVTINGDVI